MTRKILLASALAAASLCLGDGASAQQQAPAPGATNPATVSSGTNPVCTNAQALNWCAVTGAMVIPFRAELSGKKDVLGGVSADLFVGVNFWGVFGLTPTLAPTFLMYAGYLPTLNATNSAASASSTASNSGAVDFGLGFAIPVYNIANSKVVHAGAVVGFDVTGGGNKFAYNGKPYITVFAGLSF